MSKNPRGIAVPGGVARSCLGGISNMETIKDVQKAFHEAVIACEKKLSRREITWNEYVFVMLGFEAKLRSMGVVL
jgi:hypothetical protein